MADWSAEQYLKFEKERTQPVVDLLHRMDGEPSSILDVGCGPGNSTHQLAQRFPCAEIVGVDSSEDMLRRAREQYPDLRFERRLVPDGLDADKHWDVIFSNACLHWIPHHETLLPRLMERLHPQGVLAVQMPLVQRAILPHLRWARPRFSLSFRKSESLAVCTLV